MPNTRQAIREATQANEELMRKAAEETQRAAATAADASANAARAGADLLQRNVETVQRAWEAAGQTASDLAARSVQQFTRASGLSGDTRQPATHQSIANIQRIVQSGTVIAGAMQNITRECLELTQKELRQNIDGLNNLVNCRTPQELLTAQSDLLRSNLEELIASTRRIAQISLQMADDASQKMTAAAAE